MRRWCRWVVPVLALVAMTAGGPVQAQAPYSRPAISPYLNLGLNQTGNQGLLYVTQVRPQFTFYNSIQQLQQQTTTNQQAIGALQTDPGVPATGHPVGFQTHLRYFQSLGGRPGGVTVRPALVTPVRPGAGARASYSCT